MIEVRHLTAAAFGDPILEVRIARTTPVYPPSVKWVLGGFAVLCLGVAGAFALLGAYPVFGFAGLEIVVLLLLLRASFRRASVLEQVRLAGDTTVVSRDGAESARLQSYWLRIDEDAYGSARGLTLCSGPQRVAVGAGLGAQELGQLSRALREGLHRLKSGASEAPAL
jgi:uncharacterized membrane protein